MGAFDALLRETLLNTAMLCLPVLAVSALIGTAVAVLQAATQVQEQTLSLLPKLIGVGLAVALAGSFGMHLCAALFTDAVTQLAALTQP
ncbi:MAG TPA: flagellar biosynthetic protein FliQ [Candidatus Baltobacteraceae bacterium]|nr:flagellar biosynthetic protein FliQ [Candidatus Baltobacteraceae bacterium]